MELKKEKFKSYLMRVFADLRLRDNGNTKNEISPFTFIKVFILVLIIF